MRDACMGVNPKGRIILSAHKELTVKEKADLAASLLADVAVFSLGPKRFEAVGDNLMAGNSINLKIDVAISGLGKEPYCLQRSYDNSVVSERLEEATKYRDSLFKAREAMIKRSEEMNQHITELDNCIGKMWDQ